MTIRCPCVVALAFVAGALLAEDPKPELLTVKADPFLVQIDPDQFITGIRWQREQAAIAFGRVMTGFELGEGVGAPQSQWVAGHPW